MSERQLDVKQAQDEKEQRRFEVDKQYYRNEAEEDYKCTYEALQLEELAINGQHMLHDALKADDAEGVFKIIEYLVNKHRDSDADANATMKPRGE